MELALNMYLLKLYAAEDFYRDLSYLEMLATFLLVSHRIRRIALNTPTLWSIVLIGRTGFPYSLFLERSRNVPLKVFWLNEATSKDDFFWDFRRHWRSLIVISDEDFTASFPTGLVDFPALEVLEIRSHHRLHSYSSFPMPVLKHLVLRLDNTEPPLLRDLAAILANWKVLKHITFAILNGEILEDSYPIIDLPSLCSFEFSIWHYDQVETSTILAMFRAPNLRKLDICLRSKYAWPAEAIFDNLNFGESVQSLEFGYMHVRYNERFSVPFRSIARRFSNISELTVACCELPDTEQLRDCLMPTLLHLLVLWESGDPIWQDTFVDDMLAFLVNRKMQFNGQGGGYVPLRLTIDSPSYRKGLAGAVADGLVILEIGSWWEYRKKYDVLWPMYN